MLARATDRQTEIALRAALGASRGRLLRHFLAESLLLTAAGGVLGVGLAWGATKMLVALEGAGIPRAEEIPVDFRVLGFSLLVALATALACGLAPAVLATRNLQAPLRGGAAGVHGGRSHRRLRGVLVVSEVALSLLLLICAGLLIRSFWKLHRVDPGLDPENVLTFQLSPSLSSYPDGAALTAFYDEFFERLDALPGTTGVAATSLLPLGGSFDGNGVRAADQPPPPPGQELSAQTRTVTPDYFRVMGMTLERGRGLLETDAADSPQVMVISEALGELLWPGQDPIGRRIVAHGEASEVVGVLADVKHLKLDEPAPPRLYIARAQALAVWQTRRMNVVLRTASDPLALAPLVRREVWSIDSDLPLANLSTMVGRGSVQGTTHFGQYGSGPRRGDLVFKGQVELGEPRSFTRSRSWGRSRGDTTASGSVSRST